MEQNFQVRDVFNEKGVNQLAGNLARAWHGFDAEGFSNSVNSKLKALTFSERNNLIRDRLWEHLPKDYPRALEIILKALPPELPNREMTGFEGFIILPLNEFVAKYGLEHYDLSIQALYQMTKRFTAEGAIRPFIQKHPEKSLPASLNGRKMKVVTSDGWSPKEPVHACHGQCS